MDAKWGENFKKEINTKVNIEAEGRGVILVKKIHYETGTYSCFASSKLLWSFVVVPLLQIRKMFK